ncbi:MAG: hypothetical protein ABR947_13950, partial [Solirubrobacteraceae bacterium]
MPDCSVCLGAEPKQRAAALSLQVFDICRSDHSYERRGSAGYVPRTDPGTDPESMKVFRAALTAAAAVALASAPGMASATGLPVAATSAPSKQATTAVLHHRVATAGRYDVRIVIATRSGRRSNWPKATVRVEIGKVSRLAVTGGRGRAHLSAILPLKRGTLTIRARASRTRPAITVTLSRLSAPSTKATGGSGSTSSTGSTGSTGALTPAPVPVAVPLAVQAPLTASFAPDGAPILALPNGFSAITNYTNLVKDYEFDGSTLPADFRASANNSHGA